MSDQPLEDMFRGRYQHTVDPKGRVSIPAKFRDALAQFDGTLIVVPNGSALEVHPLESWQRLESRMHEKSRFDADVRKFGRLYISNAKEVSLDGVGRILLPPDTREKAGLEKDVTVVGLGLDFFEVWDRARFVEYERTNSDGIESVFERLADKGDLAVHLPVLVDEVVWLLRPRGEGWVIDGTVGMGGHAEAILERSDADVRVLGLDVDSESLHRTAARLARFGDRVRLRRANFRDLGAVTADEGVASARAVLLDLGVSSYQLDESGRGFSFLGDEPLDMRLIRRAADGGDAAQRAAGGGAGPHHLRVRRRASRAPHRARDRPPPAARDHRRPRGRGARGRSARRLVTPAARRDAHVPGDSDGRQRREGSAPSGAPSKRPGCWPSAADSGSLRFTQAKTAW